MQIAETRQENVFKGYMKESSSLYTFIERLNLDLLVVSFGTSHTDEMNSKSVQDSYWNNFLV